MQNTIPKSGYFSFNLPGRSSAWHCLGVRSSFAKGSGPRARGLDMLDSFAGFCGCPLIGGCQHCVSQNLGSFLPMDPSVWQVESDAHLEHIRMRYWFGASIPGPSLLIHANP